jgi:hypothetical protein
VAAGDVVVQPAEDALVAEVLLGGEGEEQERAQGQRGAGVGVGGDELLEAEDGAGVAGGGDAGVELGAAGGGGGGELGEGAVDGDALPQGGGEGAGEQLAELVVGDVEAALAGLVAGGAADPDGLAEEEEVEDLELGGEQLGVAGEGGGGHRGA